MQTPVTCGRCGAVALVTKHSYEHAAVEWQAGSEQICEEIPAIARTTGEHPARVQRCTAMDEAIRHGVRNGSVLVGGEDVSGRLQD